MESTAIQDKLGELKEKFGPAMEKLQRNAEDFRDKAVKFIRANPGKALGIAAGAGLITALIARKLS